MAKIKKKAQKKPIVQYDHKDKKRVNNPPVGLVTPETDKETGKKTYAYDPHLDPQLQWAGKAERMSFEVPTVSLHVHERIDPRTIIEAVRKKNGEQVQQGSLFALPEENPPLRDAIEFYKHKHNWTNRLIAGDSLLVMNSALEKEGLAGQVQMIYMDPPYGIRYGSNFQPFVNKRDVKDGKDEDLTQEPEMVKAFRDTWELEIHSYLTYLRDRLFLARELLTESGSIFVQIGDENVHKVRSILDEIFSERNFVSLISYKTSIGLGEKHLDGVSNFILWYAKDEDKLKYRQLYTELALGGVGATRYDLVQERGGTIRRITDEERLKPELLSKGLKVFFKQGLTSRTGTETTRFEVQFEGKPFVPSAGGWRTGQKGIENLIKAGRVVVEGNRLTFKKFFDDFGFLALTNFWDDVSGGIASRTDPKVYAVQTSTKVVERCLLMSTDPGDLVFDPTCGSGTTAVVAEQWGRRWITCDTSRVATTLAKQRLMTALFDYYELAHPEEGVGSGFKYKTVPHVTLGSIANNEPPGQETLYDKPFVDNSRARVTGPFTVEAVPSPAVKPIDEIDLSASRSDTMEADISIARSGETLRQAEWRAELLKCGIRGKNGQYILFSRVEPLGGTRYLHAEAETKPNTLGANSVREEQATYGKPQRVVISFGPEHAPLEQKQVELAWEEARTLDPRPSMIIFAAFQFDPEAAKDIDDTDPKKTKLTFLKVQMNTDLLTEDLKKKRASNESFWLVGQPDVKVEIITKGEDKGKVRVEVLGFDYYNTKTGTIDSGGTDKIALWMLDTDYDGRSLFARQVFFPMAGEKDGWARLAKNLKAEIDEELIEAYRGNKSLPFDPGKRIAVKIVDDRGIESLKIIEL